MRPEQDLLDFSHSQLRDIISNFDAARKRLSRRVIEPLYAQSDSKSHLHKVRFDGNEYYVYSSLITRGPTKASQGGYFKPRIGKFKETQFWGMKSPPSAAPNNQQSYTFDKGKETYGFF